MLWVVRKCGLHTGPGKCRGDGGYSSTPAAFGRLPSGGAAGVGHTKSWPKSLIYVTIIGKPSLKAEHSRGLLIVFHVMVVMWLCE